MPSDRTSLLMAMASGMGEFCFASDEWIAQAERTLKTVGAHFASELTDAPSFTLCEVAHNPPVYLQTEGPLAWFAKVQITEQGPILEVGRGELAASECDYKIQGDHSIMSNLARLQHHNRDPDIVAAAQARLLKLSRWSMSGALPEHLGLQALLRAFHDKLAPLTLPRFVFMTAEWVSSARHLLSQRAQLDKYMAELKTINYTFAEEFTHTPAYAFPNGEHGGFWVRCAQGQLTIGAGPLPSALEPADALTKGEYNAVIPVGRTYNAALSDVQQQAIGDYSKRAFRYDKQRGRAPVVQSSPSGKGDMPKVLARVFVPLHDELSKRTSGELPLDFERKGFEKNTSTHTDNVWAIAQSFDRQTSYDASWTRYDKVDLYGNPR